MKQLLDPSEQHIMLDLETLATCPTAAITEIGAVKFGQDGIEAKFILPINIQSCLNAGLTISGDTIAWMTHNAPVPEEQSETWILSLALTQFVKWIRVSHPLYTEELEDLKVYGNAAAFDNVIIRNAFAACDLSVPWKYSNDTCYRTIKKMYPEIELVRHGTHHNALDDAISQAKHLISIAKHHNTLLHIYEQGLDPEDRTA